MPWEDSNPEMMELDKALMAFSQAVRQKILFKAEQGYSGWNNPEMKNALKQDLFVAINKMHQGDENQYIDIAAEAMFLWYQQNQEAKKNG